MFYKHNSKWYKCEIQTLRHLQAKYNGNISATVWSKEIGALDTLKGYVFSYDTINRITAADFKITSGSVWSDPNNYGTSYSYDLNGNIKTLSRNNGSGTTIDNLTYEHYSGNQLNYINDGGTSAGVYNQNPIGTDYIYDDNGNMVWDKNKKLKVAYNYLNLPEKVREENGTGDELYYLYDAAGTKWMKTNDQGSSLIKTMYAGSFVYEDTDNDAEDDFGLDYILHPEGVIEVTGSTLDGYNYHLKDHLGNTRVVFNEAGTATQKTDYYPFGMRFSDTQGGSNKYLYNGKELQDEQLGGINLDCYDYGARFYDPALGRFHTQDRFAEKYLSYSPYQYAANNPTLFIDVNGDSLWIHTGFRKLLYEDGKLTTKKGKDVTHKAYRKNGKARGSFVGQAVSALGDISGTDAGSSMVSALQSSEFNFTIEQSGMSRFDPDNENNASAIMNLDPANKHQFQKGDLWIEGMSFNNIGSGGTIYWNPASEGVSGEGSSLTLGHEMFHGWDSERGILDRRYGFGSGSILGEEACEVRAVYNTNLIRQQMGLSNLRTHYSNPGISLLKNGNPINVQRHISKGMYLRFHGFDPYNTL
ncbi:MAG: RHS repeat-associated core domain-containing protein [Bacteroidota bacterium]